MAFSTIGGAGGGSAETPSGDGTSQVAFKTVSVSGQSDVVADGTEDTLTLAEGSNVTITTNAGTDTVTIAASGGATLAGIDDQSSSLDDCITILDAEVVINEDGDDQDFRIESDTLTHAFFCEGSTGDIGVNTGTPTDRFTIRHTQSDTLLDGSLGFHAGGGTSSYNSIRQASTALGDLCFDQTYATVDYERARLVRSTGNLQLNSALQCKARDDTPALIDGQAQIYAADGGPDSYTKLLLHMDGANDGTTFTDSSSYDHNVTSSGTVTKTAVKKFGTASALLDGVNDYIDCGSSDDWSFGTGNFTIEFWALKDADRSGGYDTICATNTAGANDGGGWFMEWSASRGLWFYNGVANGLIINWNDTSTSTDGAWHHVAVVQNGGTIKVYVDGAEEESASYSTAITTEEDNFLRVGSLGNGDGVFKGYIEEFRISKGVARYTGAFTPATAAFSNDDSPARLMLPAKSRLVGGLSDMGKITAFAWVWFNDSTNDSGGGDVDATGRTPVDTGSHNVSNIADGDFTGDAGQYKVTFINTAVDTNYCVIGSGDSNTTAYAGSIQGTRNVAYFQGFGSESGGWNDLDELNFVVFANPV